MCKNLLLDHLEGPVCRYQSSSPAFWTPRRLSGMFSDVYNEDSLMLVVGGWWLVFGGCEAGAGALGGLWVNRRWDSGRDGSQGSMHSAF